MREWAAGGQLNRETQGTAAMGGQIRVAGSGMKGEKSVASDG